MLSNKKYIVYVLFIAVFAISNTLFAGGDKSTFHKSPKVDSNALQIFDALQNNELRKEVFLKAYEGWKNLFQTGLIDSQKKIMALADYSLSSRVKRFWVIDLKAKKVLVQSLLAHGQGSGEDYACTFSNIEHSHQTSLGFFVTGATYTGKHGHSLYLKGLDTGFNNAAEQRAIVMHGADYVSEAFIAKEGRLGRSWGCPALPINIATTTIELIKEGVCFFAYFPSTDYLNHSKWLSKSNLNQEKFDFLEQE